MHTSGARTEEQVLVYTEGEYIPVALRGTIWQHLSKLLIHILQTRESTPELLFVTQMYLHKYDILYIQGQSMHLVSNKEKLVGRLGGSVS